MGWEKRRAKFYYYRKVWRDDRVVSVYCGGGLRGIKTEREDRRKRLAQQRKIGTPLPTTPLSVLAQLSGRERMELLFPQIEGVVAQLESCPSTTDPQVEI